jgi:hypothetical protein
MIPTTSVETASIPRKDTEITQLLIESLEAVKKAARILSGSVVT